MVNIAITIPDFVLDDLVRILQPLLNYLLDLRLLSIRMAKGSSYISTTLERGGIRSGELFGAITT